MFDIGFWELAVVGVIALLVVGPERMPGLIRTAGQWAGQVQRLVRDLRREIEREAQTDEFRKLNQDFLAEDRRLKETVRQATQDRPASQPATPVDGDMSEQPEDVTAAIEAEDGPAPPAAQPTPPAKTPAEVTTADAPATASTRSNT